MRRRGATSILDLVLLLLAVAAFAPSATADEAPLPRTVLALYDGAEGIGMRFTSLHLAAEMPLNHLGLVLNYWDIRDGLPNLDDYEDLRGVITWFSGNAMPDPAGYLNWALDAVDRDLKLVVLGNLGAWIDEQNRHVPPALIDRVMARLGLRYAQRYIDVTYRCRVASRDASIVGFERPLPAVLPPFEFYETIDPDVTTHLAVEIDRNPAFVGSLIVSGPHGGYAADGYVVYRDQSGERRQWILDPFAFFRRCFDTDDLPKPDTTTLAGRRIYYSHVDGDGWFNVSEISGYVEEQASSTRVLQDQVFSVYTDLPVTVGPVTAELEAEYYGTPEVWRLVREIFAQRHVEAGTHTHTHPFDWGFFEHYDPELERGFRRTETAGNLLRKLNYRGSSEDEHGEEHEGLFNDYSKPRAFLDHPFDLEMEIEGSASSLEKFLPEGKKVRIVQWSGNTLPFAEAVRHSRDAGMRNINGGDSRFDPEYPSYAHVLPVGREVGGERQIYASASNEVIYSDTWLGRYHGLRDLRHFVRNTETPRRVSPFNLYYHLFSGQKLSSLNAVIANLELARSSELAPVATSTYAAVADGFFSTVVSPAGRDRWRISRRDGLQTVRFDRAAMRTVDFARSEGVLGQRHLHGCLYVALDSAVPEATIALRDASSVDREEESEHPYLIHSRWMLSDLQYRERGFEVRAEGFGRGEMAWRTEPGAVFHMAARDRGDEVWSGTARADAFGTLTFEITADAAEGLDLIFLRDDTEEGGV